LADYATKYAGWNMVSSASAVVLGLSQLIMLYNVIQTARGKGEKAGDKPWEGAQGLEWTLSSPPPYHSFTIPPEVK
jgi:cytochrome c oxidase subunit 1